MWQFTPMSGYVFIRKWIAISAKFSVANRLYKPSFVFRKCGIRIFKVVISIADKNMNWSHVVCASESKRNMRLKTGMNQTRLITVFPRQWRYMGCVGSSTKVIKKNKEAYAKMWKILGRKTVWTLAWEEQVTASWTERADRADRTIRG